MVTLTRVYAKENSVVRYQKGILASHVIPYAGAVSDEFIVIDDNSRLHRTRLVDKYLEDQCFKEMEWSVHSTGLNMAEKLSDYLSGSYFRCSS